VVDFFQVWQVNLALDSSPSVSVETEPGVVARKVICFTFLEAQAESAGASEETECMTKVHSRLKEPLFWELI
jgi:hypothetical protein